MGGMVTLWLLGMFVLFLVIRWAIDGSYTAKNIQKIRRILEEQNHGISDKVDAELKEDSEAENIIFDIPSDKCPACHEKINETDEICQACGLSIKNSE